MWWYKLYENLNICTTSVDKKSEANTFASELLLPEDRMIELQEKNDLKIGLIKEVANQYETSLTAAAIRLVNLSRNSINLIYHKDGMMKWNTKSKEGKSIKYKV